MTIKAATLAIMISVLGDDLAGFDSDDLGAVLFAERVGSDSYSEKTFRDHLEAVEEKGESYVDFLRTLQADPNMQGMYAFIITSGPSGVYGLISSMGQAGLLDKKKVASAAKIAQKAAPERAWFRIIWDEIAPQAYEFIDSKFQENRAEYAKRFPELEGVNNFDDFLYACGRSTLNSGVAKLTVEQTNKETSAALGFRIDAHSAKRNGGWDPKEGAYTEDYYKAIEAAKEKAEGGTASPASNAGADSDDDDDDND